MESRIEGAYPHFFPALTSSWLTTLSLPATSPASVPIVFLSCSVSTGPFKVILPSWAMILTFSRSSTGSRPSSRLVEPFASAPDRLYYWTVSPRFLYSCFAHLSFAWYYRPRSPLKLEHDRSVSALPAGLERSKPSGKRQRHKVAVAVCSFVLLYSVNWLHLNG